MQWCSGTLKLSSGMQSVGKEVASLEYALHRLRVSPFGNPGWQFNSIVIVLAPSSLDILHSLTGQFRSLGRREESI